MGSSSVGAGVEYGNHDKSWVNEQSSIIGKNSANITVEGKTNLIGSVIGGGKNEKINIFIYYNVFFNKLCFI